jgi:hypothetical protein
MYRYRYAECISSILDSWDWIELRTVQGCVSGSGLDPDSVTLWIRILIGNPDPGSGSRDTKIKKFSGKMPFSVIKKKIIKKRD